MQFTVPMAPGAWGRGTGGPGGTGPGAGPGGTGGGGGMGPGSGPGGTGGGGGMGPGRVADPLPLDPRGRVPQEEQDLWQKR